LAVERGWHQIVALRILALAAVLVGLTLPAGSIAEQAADVDPRTILPRALTELEKGNGNEALALLQDLANEDSPDPQVLFYAARAAMMTRDFVQAERYLERLSAIAPDSPAQRQLGLLQGSQRRYLDAYTNLAPWVRFHPEDMEARLAAAMCAIELRRTPDAEELLSGLPMTHPGVRLLWGQLHNLKEDPWTALDVLRPLGEEAPPAMAPDVRRALANAYAAVGDGAAAVATLQGHVGRDPSLALQLSQAQYQSGDLEGAIETLQPFARSLLERRPEESMSDLDGNIALHYGRFLTKTGRQKEAIPYLEAAVHLRSEDKQAWLALGQSLVSVGRVEDGREALDRFQQISELNPVSSVTYRKHREGLEDPALASIRQAHELAEEDRFEAALNLVRKERALSPQDLRPVLAEIKILLHMEAYSEAHRHAVEAVRRAPRGFEALFLRGLAELGMGSPGEAQSDLRGALDLAPPGSINMSRLENVLAEASGAGETRQLIEDALELLPESSMVVDGDFMPDPPQIQ